MLKCNPKVYARCPDRHFCGHVEEACFVEGSECDKFNQRVLSCPQTSTREVVLCKDCEEWQEYEGYHICGHFSSMDLPGLCKNIVFATKPDSYCSFGILTKRNETETEDNQ